MYNYSLMNNASRLLLISHTRPDAAAAADGTNTRTYIHTYTVYTYARTDMSSTEKDVTGAHMCVAFETYVCAC